MEYRGSGIRATEKMMLQSLTRDQKHGNLSNYKKTIKEVKKVVRDAKSKAYDDLYNRLGNTKTYEMYNKA